MKANPHAPAAAAASAGLVELFERQHDESRRQPDAPLALRRDRLRRVAALWQTHERAQAKVLAHGLGQRALVG